MMIIGAILLILGWLTHIGLLTTIGAIVLIVGAILFILGSVGRPLAGRRHYW